MPEIRSRERCPITKDLDAVRDSKRTDLIERIVSQGKAGNWTQKSEQTGPGMRRRRSECSMIPWRKKRDRPANRPTPPDPSSIRKNAQGSPTHQAVAPYHQDKIKRGKSAGSARPSNNETGSKMNIVRNQTKTRGSNRNSCTGPSKRRKSGNITGHPPMKTPAQKQKNDVKNLQEKREAQIHLPGTNKTRVPRRKSASLGNLRPGKGR